MVAPAIIDMDFSHWSWKIIAPKPSYNERLMAFATLDRTQITIFPFTVLKGRSRKSPLSSTKSGGAIIRCQMYHIIYLSVKVNQICP